MFTIRFLAEKTFLLIDFPVFLLTDDGPEDADSAFSGFCFFGAAGCSCSYKYNIHVYIEVYTQAPKSKERK